MKKRIAALVMLLMLSTGIVQATSNPPFADVPENHWAFEAINQLAKDGIIDGNNGKFNGDNTITRYEMAQMVAEALTKYEKVDGDAKRMMDKLKKEFSMELKTLDSRLDDLEDRSSNFKINSEIRIRSSINTVKNDATNSQIRTSTQAFRSRFWIKANIDDNWQLTTRLENTQNMLASGNDSGTTQAQSYLKGNVGNVELTFGRLPYSPIYGFVADNHQEGIKIGFGDRKKDVRVTLNYGREGASNVFVDGSGRYLGAAYTNRTPDTVVDSGSKAYTTQTRLASIELARDFSPVTSAEVGYITYKGLDLPSNLNVPTAKFLEVGVTTKYGENITLKGNYVKSNALTENTGYFGSVTYKKYDASKPGSWDVYMQYMHQEKRSLWATTYDGMFQDSNGLYHGYKGPIIGFHYVPFKNAYLDVNYSRYTATDDNNWKDDLIRATMYLKF